MKKFMAVFFVAMLLVMSLGNIVTAMADVGTARPFSIYVQCMNSILIRTKKMPSRKP